MPITKQILTAFCLIFLAASWQEAFVGVQNLAANWQEAFVGVQNLAANWQEAFVGVQNLAANWQEAFVGVQNLAASWQEAFLLFFGVKVTAVRVCVVTDARYIICRKASNKNNRQNEKGSRESNQTIFITFCSVSKKLGL